jgi:phage shock protein A
MFGAIGRWFNAIYYAITGGLDDARRDLDTNPNVMRAKYKEIIEEKTSRVQEYKQAVATLLAQQEKKTVRLEKLQEDANKLENLKSGALAKAKQEAARLKKAGKGKDEIQSDPDYKRCLAAFQDFSSTLAEKKERMEELEGDIESYRQRVGKHKIQLQSVAREIEKLKTEAADAVADIIGAKEEQKMADMLSGISEDTTGAELERMRDLKERVKAEAKISSELAGTDAVVQEREFLEYARQKETDNEFDTLVGLGELFDDEPEESAPAEKVRSEKLPE